MQISKREFLKKLGLIGAAGATGATGERGATGATGARGESAYELAVDNGYRGTEAQWLASLVGAPGKDGADGKDGANGKDGAAGKDGTDGVDGKDGIGIKNIYIDEDNNLMFELTDGKTVNAGKVSSESSNPSDPTPSNPPVVTYTVKFCDYDGTVLKTCTVEKGSAATAPGNPSRDGYTFTGWDKSFTNVTSNLTVTAQYEKQSTDPMLSVGKVSASAGATQIAVPVSIKNNPGFLGLTLKIEYDSSTLTLTKASRGSDFSDYSFTAPKNMASPCRAGWSTTDVPSEIVDGDVMILYFTVSNTAAAGTYNVKVTCDEALDGDWNDFSMSAATGGITIK